MEPTENRLIGRRRFSHMYVVMLDIEGTFICDSSTSIDVAKVALDDGEVEDDIRGQPEVWGHQCDRSSSCIPMIFCPCFI